MSFLGIDFVLASRIVLAVFLHFIWQVTAIILFVVLVRSTIRTNTSMRYVALVLGLLASLAAPLTTGVYYLTNPALVSLCDTSGVTSAVVLTRATSEPLATNSSIWLGLRRSVESQLNSVFQFFEQSRELWLAVWLAGFVILAMRLFISLSSCQSLRRSAIPLPLKIERIAERVKYKMAVSGSIVIQGSNEITQAIATGVVRPIVLIPMAWLTQLPTHSIEAIVAHELAHIRRFDLWVNLLQRLTETLFFFHPLVWWLSGKIDVEREILCDELAIECTGDRLSYAKTLSWVAEMKDLQNLDLCLGTAFRGENKMNLLRRVRMILEPSTLDGIPSFRLPVIVFCMSATLTIVSLAFSMTTDPIVARQQSELHEHAVTYRLHQDGDDGEAVIVLEKLDGDGVPEHLNFRVVEPDGGGPQVWKFFLGQPLPTQSGPVRYRVERIGDVKDESNYNIEADVVLDQASGHIVLEGKLHIIEDDERPTTAKSKSGHEGMRLQLTPRLDNDGLLQIVVDASSPKGVWKVELDRHQHDSSEKTTRKQDIWIQESGDVNEKIHLDVRVDDETAGLDSDIFRLKQQIEELRKEVRELKSSSKSKLNRRKHEHKDTDTGHGVYRLRLQKDALHHEKHETAGHDTQTDVHRWEVIRNVPHQLKFRIDATDEETTQGMLDLILDVEEEPNVEGKLWLYRDAIPMQRVEPAKKSKRKRKRQRDHELHEQARSSFQSTLPMQNRDLS